MLHQLTEHPDDRTTVLVAQAHGRLIREDIHRLLVQGMGMGMGDPDSLLLPAAESGGLLLVAPLETDPVQDLAGHASARGV
ncbi:hypothetical protein GCM10009859_23550 [Kocuria salsicia]